MTWPSFWDYQFMWPWYCVIFIGVVFVSFILLGLLIWLQGWLWLREGRRNDRR